jgi:putative ABC transport system ATP-binding protein
MSKTYTVGQKRILALRNVNLEIRRGEFVAITGSSGQGKTTLLNIMACLDRPSSGKVFLDGEELAKMRDSQLTKLRRNKIGFVFQSFNLLPYLNARENVELAMEGTGTSRDGRSKRAHELLELVGLSGREEHRPSRLSAGEQQRVAIARAIANNPSVIFADEPTGNLDGKTRKKILKILIDLNLGRGVTMVVVTHDDHVAGEAGRILQLRQRTILGEKRGNLAGRKPEDLSPVSPSDSSVIDDDDEDVELDN